MSCEGRVYQEEVAHEAKRAQARANSIDAVRMGSLATLTTVVSGGRIARARARVLETAWRRPYVVCKRFLGRGLDEIVR